MSNNDNKQVFKAENKPANCIKVDDYVYIQHGIAWLDTKYYGTITCLGKTSGKHINGWKEKKQVRRRTCERDDKIIFQNTKIGVTYNTDAFPDEFFADK